MRKTPLHATHVGLGATMVDFSGWHMPIRYDGIIPEAEATRQRVGLFDIGHMGRLELVGPDHVEAADWVCSANIGKLATGRVKYGFLLTEQATVIDDVLVYRDVDRTHIVVNAGNRDVDRDHVREQVAAKGLDCKVIDTADPEDAALDASWLGTDQTMIALQGPRSQDLLGRVVGPDTDLDQLGYYRMTRGSVLGLRTLVSRTGYTGEDGFELFFDARQGVRVWEALVSEGKDLGAKPVGLGARDTLRLEAGMPLYGNELDRETTPLEAGLKFGVAFKKGDYFGKPALAAARDAGPRKLLASFEVDTKRVPRHGHTLEVGGETIGVVASGSFSPTLGKNIATGFVPPALAEVGSTFDVNIRGKVHGCTVVAAPFYKRSK